MTKASVVRGAQRTRSRSMSKRRMRHVKENSSHDKQHEVSQV